MVVVVAGAVPEWDAGAVEVRDKARVCDGVAEGGCVASREDFRRSPGHFPWAARHESARPGS